MRNRRSFLAGAVLLAVLGMAAARAWTSDDAFITFRVVDQFLAGHGPVYNIGERVQAFTHPLWFLALSAWAAAGGSLFPGAMLLSLALFGAGLAFLHAAFRDRPVALAALGIALLLCRAVVDFATSGLETPLTFALFAAAVHAIRTDRGWRAVALLALLPLNRLDLLPWALPFAWIAVPTLRARVAAAAALAAPAAGWALFSTVYYGAPLPNTALAKLAGGPLAGIDNGLAYLVASLLTDPGAMALLVLALVALVRGPPAVARDGVLARAALASAAIAFAYVLWVGGDFMLGRFLLPVLWALVVALLACAPRESAAAAATARQGSALRFAARTLAVLAICHLLLARSTLALDLDLWPEEPLRTAAYAGVVDERRYYLPWFGLHASAKRRAIVRPGIEPRVAEPKRFGAVGIQGYRQALEQPVVDYFGLVDPLVARILPLPNSRPGHGYRPLPPQFWRWREPDHAFGDASLDAVAERLRLAHRDRELWSAERWRAVAWLALHRTIALAALTVTDEGTSVRITVRPDLLYYIAGREFDSYLVALRIYDSAVRRAERGATPDAAYDRALDRDCRVSRGAPGSNRATAIEVARGESLVLRCPASLARGDGILMRVGARVPTPEGPVPAYDDAVPVTRPALRWWAESAPGWVADAWREDPSPALLVALALFAAAGVLSRRARGAARADGPVAAL